MKSQRGLSIVELLVGMGIGLFAALVIVQSFASSEAARRSTTGQADAQQVGTLTSWRMTRELRLAGNGLSNTMNLWGCRLRAWRSGSRMLPKPGTWPTPFETVPTTLRLVPLTIVDGGGNTPDILISMGASNGIGGAASTATVASSSAVETQTTLGFQPGDLLMMSSPAQLGGDCQIGQVDSTYTPAAVGQTAPTTVPTSQTGAIYNHANGFNKLPQPGDYTLINLGATPQFHMFGVDAEQQLVQLDMLRIITRGTPAPIAQNVVNLQALYGVDDGSGGGTANDNIIDGWVTATAAYSLANLHANGESALPIKAIRMALVVRTSQVQSSLSPASLTLFPDLATDLQVSLSFSGAERSFQYQVYDSVIPLPNQRIALCSEHRRYNAVPLAGVCS